MGLPNGVHHLAISVGDIKQQIEYYTQVVGLEMVALYWMHGVEKTFHCFFKLNDSSYLALVHNKDIAKLRPVPGLSHPAGWTADNTAPGTMQHVALNVDTEAELLAIRDRVRSHGSWVMGPLDHGFCKSCGSRESTDGVQEQRSARLFDDRRGSHRENERVYSAGSPCEYPKIERC